MLCGQTLRGHGGPVMHAPQEGIVLEDCPLHSLQRCPDGAERACHVGPWPRAVALLFLSNLDAFGQGSPRHPDVPQRMRERDHGREGVENRVQLVSCLNGHHRDTLTMQSLRQARRHLGPGLLQLRFIEPRDRDTVVICFRNCCARYLHQPLPQRHLLWIFLILSMFPPS